MVQYHLDEWGTPTFTIVSYWGDVAVGKVNTFGWMLFGSFLFYLGIENVQAVEAHGASEITTSLLDSMYVLDVLVPILTYALVEILNLIDTTAVEATTTLNEVINIIDMLSSEIAYGLLETITLAQVYKGFASLITDEGWAVLVSLTDTGSSVFNTLTDTGRFVFVIGALSSEVIVQTGALNVVLAQDTYSVIAYPSALLEVVEIVDSVSSFLTTILLEVVEVIGSYSLEALSYRSEFVRIVRLPTSIYPIAYLSEFVRLVEGLPIRVFTTLVPEVISIADLTLQYLIARPLYEIVRVLQLTGRTEVQSFRIEFVRIVDILKVQATTYLIPEVLNLLDIEYAEISQDMIEFVRIVDGLRPSFTIFMLETLDVIDSYTTRATSYIPEILTLVEEMTARPVHNLPEVIRLIEFNVSRIITTSILNAINILDVPSVIAKSYLEAEIVNMVEAHDISTIIAYLRETIRLYDDLLGHLYFDLVETLKVLDPVSRVNVLTTLVTEVLEILDIRATSLSKSLAERIDLLFAYSLAATTYVYETINIIDDVYSIFGVVLTEMMIFIDTLAVQPTKILSELLLIIDDVISEFGVLLVEIISLVETLTKKPSPFMLESILLTEMHGATLITKYMDEIIELVETLISWPMKLLTSETMSITDTYRVSALTSLIVEAITLADDLERNAIKFLVELVRAVDIRCSRGVSTIRIEVVNVLDVLRRDIPQVLLETILLSDVRMPVVVSYISEALRVVDTTIKAVSVTLVLEVINVIDVLAMEVKTYGVEAIVVMDTLSTSLIYGAFKEVVGLGQTMYKIYPTVLLVLESLSIADTRTWYDNIIHRLETKIRQFTDIKAEAKSTKETKIKKITEDTKRE